MSESTGYYGVSAEFASPEALLDAVRRLRARGIGLLDALSPLPIPGMSDALGLRGPSIGWIAALSVVAGGIGCFGLICYATMSEYPSAFSGYTFSIAGRPFFSWPYYVIPSIAAATATAATVAFVAMLFLNRLPRLNHPVFNVDGIEGVTQDRLFLIVEARSEDFDPMSVERALAELPMRPLRIQQVPR